MMLSDPEALPRHAYPETAPRQELTGKKSQSAAPLPHGSPTVRSRPQDEDQQL
jgi:hypothetical protein